ncbi:acyl-CoA dehydrogenase family protein [Actinomycetospora endophytica]|uniref:Acyl-CoA dehydrogenase family protein n=1 Tax=Actinomycetospora endophytica TaxID=2291215 RepID=A0ABS8PAN1_9PSEU|nr:acyl-CoA dehydrogenase family protein [Actinomycetospora endophytica]MCD2195321.1 acyl-CoA dehydrogenase family protein [Actinomycetospora endophytica]
MTSTASTTRHADLGALRREIREFLTEQRAAGAFTPTVDVFARSHDPAFSARLGGRGWLGMTWPAEYGGHERSVLERFAVLEELLAAGAPIGAHWIAERQTGPLLLRLGTEDQRRRFLPAIAAGELFVSIGMSEPDSGSDLASVRTRAEPVEGGWSLSGRKIWSTFAHRSGWLLALVRTGPPGDDRHGGLSQMFVDLSSPGVEVSPIASMGGGPAHFCEVLLDEVFVPTELVLGTVGEGWAQVSGELADERSGPDRYLTAFPLLAALVSAYSAAGSEALDPTAAVRLGEILARLRGVRALSIEVQRALAAGEAPVVTAAMVKDRGTLLEQDLVEVAAALTADLPTARDRTLDRLLTTAQLAAPTFTLRGGTTQILRSIVVRSLDGRPAAHDDVADAVDDLVDAHAEVMRGEERTLGWSPTLWAAFVEGGFAEAPLPGTVDDSAAGRSVLRALGRRAAPIGTVEHAVATWTLQASGLPVPDGVLTLAVAPLVGPAREPGAPWAGSADAVVVHGTTGTLSLGPLPDPTAADLAGTRWAPVDTDQPGAPAAVDPRPVLELGRLLVVSGAMRRVQELTVTHARSRKQFGRPLAAFQAVGQQLAELAGAIAEADAAIDAAADALDVGNSEPLLAAIVDTDLAVRRVTAIAHQVHGALGVTAEYELHHLTRRLTAWRTTGTSATAAAAEIGRRAVHDGADALWPALATDTA